MPAPANQIKTEDIDASLSQEFVRNFNHDADRLMEILGLFDVERRHAGRALFMYEVTGELNDKATDESSSGRAYKEGDLVALSNFKVNKVPIGELKAYPYRKQTTYQAILDDGYEAAVIKTDNRLRSQIRSAQIVDFFDFLQKGTGTASASGLQSALAFADATLQDTLEEKHDETDSKILHFVNRMDAAAYLAGAEITMQSLFGMTYLENFMGVSHVFLTNKIPSGKIIVTPADNVRAFTVDFSELARGGLVYQTEARGLIGVAHKGAYDHVSAETNVLVGLQLVPEVLDFIVVATFGKASDKEDASGGAGGESSGDKGAGDEGTGGGVDTQSLQQDADSAADTPSIDWTKAELTAYCVANDIAIDESMTKAQILDAIAGN